MYTTSSDLFANAALPLETVRFGAVLNNRTGAVRLRIQF